MTKAGSVKRFRMSTRRGLAAGVAVLVLGLVAGCSASTDSTSAEPVASEPVASSPVASSPVAVPTEGAPEPGTADAAAWEALIGEDGEYMSAAMYDAVLKEFGTVEPYVTILAAENHHSDMLAMHLRRAGYEVPTNPYLGKVDAPSDLVAAANAWAEGEKRNVAMYDALAKQAKDDAQLTMMFTHLKGASQNAHLPLFEAAAVNGGQLDQSEMAKWSNSMIMMGAEMGEMGGMGSMGGSGMGGSGGAHDMSGHDMSSMSPSPSN